ncbi:hypothetical protein [Paraburkholderia dioscoreae]|nr:hypothetical protein [Paraburkholderia dioscoreae]
MIMNYYRGYFLFVDEVSHSDGSFSAYGIIFYRNELLMRSRESARFETEDAASGYALLWARTWVDEWGLQIAA